MSFSISKHHVFLPLILSLTQLLLAGDDFPAWESPNLFKQDLRRASLVTVIPNLTEADHFMGIQLTGTHFLSNTGSAHQIPTARISIYPNPGYNVWGQFARWLGSNPNFSIGTGLQVEFESDNLQVRQAVGISWNTLFHDGYTQRDIAVHGLYGFSRRNLGLGLMAIIDFHHLIVENGNGIPDYDETIFIGVPYISMIVRDIFKFSVEVPYNSTGPALVIGSEMLIGKRK